jgi:hypothetical protein
MPGAGSVTVGKCASCGQSRMLTGGYCDYCRRYWNGWTGTRALRWLRR